MPVFPTQNDVKNNNRILQMEEIIKQDYITLEDYPEDEMVKNIKEYHDFLLNHFRNGYLW